MVFLFSQHPTRP